MDTANGQKSEGATTTARDGAVELAPRRYVTITDTALNAATKVMDAEGKSLTVMLYEAEAQRDECVDRLVEIQNKIKVLRYRLEDHKEHHRALLSAKQ